MIVIVDTREQLPWKFPGFEYQVQALKSGDYSLAGYENQVSIERKSLNDFIGTLTKGRERFERELKRLESCRYKCVVVETDLAAIFNHEYNSAMTPKSVIGLVLRLMMDYNIPVFFASDRNIAAKFAISFLKRAYNRLTDPEKYGTMGEKENENA